MVDQVKLVHEVIDGMYRSNREFLLQLLYNMDKLESSCDHARLFAILREEEIFRKIVYLKKNLKNWFVWLTLWILFMIKLLLSNPFVMSSKGTCNFLISTFFIRDRMSWNIGDNRNHFLKLKSLESELGFFMLYLEKSKLFSKKPTLTPVEIRQLPDIEMTDATEKISCLKWATYNGWREVKVNYWT